MLTTDIDMVMQIKMFSYTEVSIGCSNWPHQMQGTKGCCVAFRLTKLFILPKKKKKRMNWNNGTVAALIPLNCAVSKSKQNRKYKITQKWSPWLETRNSLIMKTPKVHLSLWCTSVSWACNILTWWFNSLPSQITAKIFYWYI